MPVDRARVHIGSAPEPDRELPGDEVFRLCLLGDFSGDPGRVPLSARKPMEIDRDNFEHVLGRMGVSIAGMPVRELDDLHPDTLYAHSGVFEAFRSIRQRLQDPQTSADAIRELRGDPEPPPRPKAADADNLLELIIGSGPVAAAPARARAEDDLQRFVREAVRPWLVARPDPRLPQLIAEVDAAASRTMQAILHAPAFRSIEGAWRTVFQIVRRLETGPELKVCLLDVSKEELAAAPLAVAQALLRRSEEWSVLALCYPFGTADLQTLAMMSEVGHRVKAPVVAEAEGSLLDDSPEWRAFRQTEQAARVGLVLPRILLRLPYGKASSPCEAFEFEEVDAGPPDPRRLLWGNPAAFCAMLMAQRSRRIDGLPICVYTEDGESAALPSAEIGLTEDTAEALLDNGIMPFVAVRDAGEVRLLRLQSAAFPAQALPGA